MSIKWLTAFLDLPSRDFDRGVDFWCTATGTHPSTPRGPGGRFMTLSPADGDAYLRVQRIDDGPGGCHLDLHLDPALESLDAAGERAVTLGARLLSHDDDLVVLVSPGGFTFCLVPWRGEQQVPAPAVFASPAPAAFTVPAPGVFPVPEPEIFAAPTPATTGVSRVHHFCLDIPAWSFEAECLFWGQFTSWAVHQASVPGFAYLGQPTPSAVELLFQRRQTAEPEDLVTAHLDLACSDPGSLAAAHREAGSRIIGEHKFWFTLTDPVGREYCLVRNDHLSD